MNNLLWTGVFLLSLLVGGLVVAYLVVPPLSLSLFTVLLALSAGGLVVYLWRLFPGRDLALAIPLCLVGIIAGYLAANYAFLAQKETRALPPVDPPAAGDSHTASDGHTAVIYFTHGEPPGYSPLPWLETFRELDADAAPFIPTPFRAFFFHSLRSKYLEMGGSPHNFVHQAMLNRLEEIYRTEGAFQEEGDAATRFYLSFLDANPRPDEMAIRAINAGAKRLVLLPVFLTVSNHTQAGFDMVDALHPEQYGVEVRKADPLWDSPLLKQMFLERANRSLGRTPKSRAGILLVGHGQPDAWDRLFPTETEQETSFRRAVIELLVQDGYARENISLAWMEFKEPKVPEIAAEMGKKQIDKLLVFSAAISSPSMHSEYDVPELVREAKLPASIEVINLGAWGADPLVIRAIREQLAVSGY